MGYLLHRTVTPMTGTSGMVYVSISARWNISHASVQVLGGTSQKAPTARRPVAASWRRPNGWKENLQEQGGALLFFLPNIQLNAAAQIFITTLQHRLGKRVPRQQTAASLR